MGSLVSQFLESGKSRPAWVRPEARVITVKQCGRKGPNVGFPPLTHDRVAVRNWVQNTCSHLQSQLAVVLGRLRFFWASVGRCAAKSMTDVIHD